MKRLISLGLSLVLLCGLLPSAYAASSEAVEAADELYALGLFTGTGFDADGKPIYDLDRAPTRYEAVTMLVRLLGKEDEAKAGTWETPFADVVDWAKPYVGYAYAHGLTTGTSAATFGGDAQVDAAQYLTFVLRALGYESGSDFRWDRAWWASDTIGLTHGEYNRDNYQDFIRGDVAVISRNALYQKQKNSGETLLDSICKNYQYEQRTAPKADFHDLLAQANAVHKDWTENRNAFGNVGDYVVNEPETADLLTKEEINALLGYGACGDPLTYEQAAEDVDLLFRAFHSTYGAYYYFGQEAFDVAQAQVMDWLNGKDTVRGKDLESAIHMALMPFWRDAHSELCNTWEQRDEILWYEYFYCPGQRFARDEAGCYQEIDGHKWYLDSFSDERVKMVPSLTKEGELIYAPVLFCPRKDMTFSALTLKSADGGELTQKLVWTESEAYGESQREPDFKLLEEKGVAYISERCFDPEFRNGALKDFVASGAKVKDAELIIFDIRANGGGESRFSREWVKNFTGVEPRSNQIHAARASELFRAWKRQNGQELGRDDRNPGSYMIMQTQGRQIKNDIPIIVLVDDMCGSSGESMLNDLRSLENVLIVGSNSAGYQLGGNCVDFRLPNSGVPVQLGTFIQFFYSNENVDLKGYEPDVWCDPKDALDAVLNMLTTYELADADVTAALRDAI